MGMVSRHEWGIDFHITDLGERSMSSAIRISAKNLGALALPNCCLRCFWLRLRMQHRLPFQVFPGIFSTIDVFTKRVVHAHFDQHGKPPDWLSDLGEISGYHEPPHYSKFNIVDEEYNILITGTADGIFDRADGTFLIIDYKTARFTDKQDALLPLYEVQLNAYAMIGECCGFSPVSGLALIYMEPMTDAAEHRRQGRPFGFEMGFRAHVLEVDVDPSLVRPLLARTREIWESAVPPPGRPGCKDCRQVEELVSVRCTEPRPHGNSGDLLE